MQEEKDKRPFLIWRKTRWNRFTLPVLLGCLEGEGLAEHFRTLIAGSVEEILPKVETEKALIGFSFMTPHLLQVQEEVARLRRSLGKEAILIAGGSHATGDPEGTGRLGFDYVFTGEAEKSFPDFLRQFLQNKLPGTTILGGDKESCLFSTNPPFSVRERFFAPLELTRGCLYSCGFCQTPRIFGHTLRHRHPDTVAGHLRQAIPYGYHQTAFVSPNAFSYGATSLQGPNLPAIEKLLESCRHAGCEGIHFGCYPSEVRPEWVTPEVLHLVKKYCLNKTIVLGAQSGSNSLLGKLNRAHSAEQALKASCWIHQAGFMPHVDFVFGFPEETQEDRQLSLSLMKKMIEEHGAKVHVHTYLPLPGTPLFQKEPSGLDNGTKNVLRNWGEKGKLDGWWKEQEIIAWKIVEWRDRGLIGTQIHPVRCSPSNGINAEIQD
jgi:B12-binding domain/radical SAM domain protein